MSCPNCGSATHVSCDPLDQAANQVANTVAKQGPEQREEWVNGLVSAADDLDGVIRKIDCLIKQWPATGDELHFSVKRSFSSASFDLKFLAIAMRAMHVKARSE